MIKFNLYKYIDSKIENLSSGSIQKLRLIISFYSDSEFILLDEPTTNLDNEGKKSYMEVLNEFADKKGIIIATNDKEDIIEKNTQLGGSWNSQWIDGKYFSENSPRVYSHSGNSLSLIHI